MKGERKFAEGIIEKKIGDVMVNVNRDFAINHVKEKEMVADVKMISKENGGVYILEMQRSASNGLTKRFAAYASSEYKTRLEKGMNYNKLPPVTLIAIMTKNIPKFKNIDKYHTVWNGREEMFKDEIFEEDITIHVIELPKYIEHKKKTNKVNIWLEFIIDPLGKEVEEAMRTKEELRLAVDMLNLLNSDEEVRSIALKEILDDMDRVTAIEEGEQRGLERGIEQGIEKGLEQGIEQGRRETAKKMLQKGMKIEDIMEVTGLTREEIESLK